MKEVILSTMILVLLASIASGVNIGIDDAKQPKVEITYQASNPITTLLAGNNNWTGNNNFSNPIFAAD